MPDKITQITITESIDKIQQELPSARLFGPNQQKIYCAGLFYFRNEYKHGRGNELLERVENYLNDTECTI